MFLTPKSVAVTFVCHQWKMSFNPDKSTQAHETKFSYIILNVIHPPANFNKYASCS